MKYLLNAVIAATILLFSTLSFTLQAKTNSAPINVTFFVPAERNNPFWSLVENSMQVAAKQFNINVTTHYIEDPSKINRYYHLKRVKEVLNNSKNIDYFITGLFSGKTEELLAEVEKRQVKFISIINDALPQSIDEISSLKKKYSYWIGQVVTDDVYAGKYLAEILLNEAKARNAIKTDVFGISGGRDNSASILRNNGLKSAFVEEKNYVLRQVVYTEWRYDLTINRTQGLLSRYKNPGIIWCANDGVIAEHVIATVKEFSYKPNEDVLIGGMDWSKRGMELIKAGELTATIGGHFLDGGITMALVYDHHNGVDFNEQFKGSVKQKMIRLANNLENADKLINGQMWHKLNFRGYSRVLNPDQKSWDLNYQRVLSTF